MGRSQAVLIKGGHSFEDDGNNNTNNNNDNEGGGGVAQDYFLDSQAGEGGGVWVTSPR